MAELKRCPFCGTPARLCEEIAEKHRPVLTRYYVYCPNNNCLASIPCEGNATREQAFEIWNRRTP